MLFTLVASVAVPYSLSVEHIVDSFCISFQTSQPSQATFSVKSPTMISCEIFSAIFEIFFSKIHSLYWTMLSIFLKVHIHSPSSINSFLFRINHKQFPLVSFDLSRDEIMRKMWQEFIRRSAVTEFDFFKKQRWG